MQGSGEDSKRVFRNGWIRQPPERKEVDSLLNPAQYVQKQGYRYNQPVMCVVREDGQKLELI